MLEVLSMIVNVPIFWINSTSFIPWSVLSFRSSICDLMFVHNFGKEDKVLKVFQFLRNLYIVDYIPLVFMLRLNFPDSRLHWFCIDIDNEVRYLIYKCFSWMLTVLSVKLTYSHSIVFPSRVIIWSQWRESQRNDYNMFLKKLCFEDTNDYDWI